MTENQMLSMDEVNEIQHLDISKQCKILVFDNSVRNEISAVLKEIPGYLIKYSSNLNDLDTNLVNTDFNFIIADYSTVHTNKDVSWIKKAKEKDCVVFIVKDAECKDEYCNFLLNEGIDDFLQYPLCETILNQRIAIHNRLQSKKFTINNLKKGLENLEEENSNKLIKMYNDLQLAYKELELRKKELESLDKAKSDFIKIVSHEIRTPLSGIIGFSQLLESKLPGEYNNYIGSLNQSALRLQEFSNKAILISKLKTSSYKINHEPISVLYIINSIIEKYDTLIKQKKLTIRNSVSHRIVNSDFGLCEKTFQHIMDNAIRFAPEGSTIFVEELYTNGRLTIMFIDQGPGFSEAVFNNIFGLFAHGENYIDKNVGLGLYMVKLIMNYLGGSVKVANNIEGGALVKLIFNI